MREITATIDEIARAGFLLVSELHNDFRTDQIGTIGGKLSFLDGSQLHFTEYLDLRRGIDRIAFSYHYQSAGESTSSRPSTASGPGQPSVGQISSCS